MEPFTRLLTVACLVLLASYNTYGQNGIIGSGFTNGWTSPNDIVSMLESAGGSRILTTTARGTGNRFFRVVVNWSSNNDQYTMPGGDVSLAVGTIVSTSTGPTSSGAMFINATNMTDNYIFKTRAGGSPPPVSNNLVVYRVEGTVRSVSNVTRSPSSTILAGEDVTITATLDGAFATGQAVFLRYSTNSFGASTIVKMTGSGTTYTATIPAGTNVAGTEVQYYVFTSGDVASIAHGDADLCTINLNNNSGANFRYTPISGVRSIASSDWNTTSTWSSGVLPTAGQNVVIRHAVTVNGSVTNVPGTVTIESGSSLNFGASGTLSAGTLTNNGTLNMSSGGTLTVTSGGTLTNTATFTAGTGTVVFAGSATVNGTYTFNNVTTNGTISLQGDQVNGILQINAGGAISSGHAPTYGSASTLRYNSGGTYNVNNNEWYENTFGTSAGVPRNVEITNNTNIVLNGGFDREITGNITIRSGSTLTLSATSGGDLLMGGNWTRESGGNFTTNNRAVFFNGTGTQTITSGSGTESFAYFFVNKSSGNVTLATGTNVRVVATVSNVLQLDNGGIDLNGQTFTVYGNNSSSATGNIHVVGGTRSITGTGTFRIGGPASSPAPANANWLTKNVTQASGGRLSFGANVTVVIDSGQVDFGVDGGTPITTINGTLQVGYSGSVRNNSCTYADGSTLRFANGIDYQIRNDATGWPGFDRVWGPGTSGAGVPFNVEITGAGTSPLLHGSRTARGSVAITSGGTLNLTNGTLFGDLNVGGNWTRDATSSFVPSSGSSHRTVTFNGSGTQVISRTGTSSAEDFAGLTVNKSTGIVQTNSPVTVSQTLTLNGTASGITLNGQTLTVNNSSTTAITGTGYVISESQAGTGRLAWAIGGTTGSDYTFPLANAAGTRIDVTIRLASGNVGTLGIATFNSPNGLTLPTGTEAVTNVSVNNTQRIQRFWYLNTAATTYNATATFRYLSAEDPSAGVSNTGTNGIKMERYAKSSDTWSGYWAFPGQSYTHASRSVSVPGITSFSWWGGGNLDTQPLPVSLLQFTGKRTGPNTARLDWTTTFEQNNYGFEVEKSTDGRDFSTIGFVAGRGNSQTLQRYQLYDPEFYQSAYYRLRQIDLNGTTAYSNVVFLPKEGSIHLVIAPNPSTGPIQVQLGEYQGELKAELFGVDAKRLEGWQGELTAVEQGINLRCRELPKGMYLLRIQAGEQTIVEKLIRQ